MFIWITQHDTIIHYYNIVINIYENIYFLALLLGTYVGSTNGEEGSKIVWVYNYYFNLLHRTELFLTTYGISDKLTYIKYIHWDKIKSSAGFIL